MMSSNWTLELPSGLHFDEADHRYTLDGRPIAGLTRLLEDCGYYPYSEWYTEQSRQRGTAVHKAIELVGLHGLERVRVDDRLHLYLQGYQEFLTATGFRPVAHEIVACSRIYRCGCIADIAGYMRDKLSVIDVKTWGDSKFRVQRGAELQTAGQALMLEECGSDRIHERYVLQLTGKPGRLWKLFPCSNPLDRSMFINLTIHWWDRHDNGLLKNWRPPVIPAEEYREGADDYRYSVSEGAWE